jgi:hypothetical protein
VVSIPASLIPSTRSIPTCCATRRLLSLGKAGPRDLAAVRGGLDRAATVVSQLRASPELPPGLMTAGRELSITLDADCGALFMNLRRALVPEPTAIGQGVWVYR